ncbi:MAG: PEGA domain-containing protein [Myxococcota bacterium]
MRLFLLATLCWALPLSTTAAQTEGRWLIIPVNAPDDGGSEWVEQAVARTRAALVEEGADVWSTEAAAREFEATVSAPAATFDESELERWMSLSDAAVGSLAEGRYEKALEELDAAQAMSRNAIEEYNRDAERARRVFDTCLYMVRAVVATEGKSRARALARECRRLVPRAEPSPLMHPPAVTTLLAEIDDLRAKQSGELRVDSTPPGCAARLNGVLLGETPVSIDGVFPGEYLVQVECDRNERGRVHRVNLGAGRFEREVDLRFDEAIGSQPGLSLTYATHESEAERTSDARRIARALGATSVVLLSLPDTDTLELERIDVEAPAKNPRTGLARIPFSERGRSQSSFAEAARALVGERCVDFTSKEPVAFPCTGGSAPAAATTDARPAGRRPRGQLISGLTLVGVGVASLATGYALLNPRSNAAERWIDEVDAGGQDTSAQQKWFDLRSGILATASIGGAALVAAMPLALPERGKTPWWAWMSGGLGVGLAAFSIAWGVTAEAKPVASCSDPMLSSDDVRSCAKRGDQTGVAVLTGLTAAPLITMPLVYLLRPRESRIAPTVEVGRTGASVSLRGRF